MNKIEWFSKIVQVGTFPENFDQNWRPQESYGNDTDSIIVWEIKVFDEVMKIHHYPIIGRIEAFKFCDSINNSIETDHFIEWGEMDLLKAFWVNWMQTDRNALLSETGAICKAF